MKFVLLIIAAYLVGSIPFGLILARLHGKDLRNIGSGNIGATNLSRALGRKWGYFCFLLDVAKGALPVITAGQFLSGQPGPIQLLLWLITGSAAIIGHIFPLYIGFKGGKGVATSFGVALGLWPFYTIPALISLAVWIVVTLIWRYISLASIVASVTFPISLAIVTLTKQNWQFINLWPLFLAGLAIPLMVITRHRTNIRRLLTGTESKVFNSKKD